MEVSALSSAISFDIFIVRYPRADSFVYALGGIEVGLNSDVGEDCCILQYAMTLVAQLSVQHLQIRNAQTSTGMHKLNLCMFRHLNSS